MTDHDAIAATIRAYLATGGDGLLPDLPGAYLDLYDEVKRLRAHNLEQNAELHRAVQDRAHWQTRCEAAHASEGRLMAERDALRAHPYLPAEEIAAIERSNRRWHGEYDTTISVRWEPYKPDGQRQMKAKGRWQTMTHNTSGYFRWENCERPAHVRQALKGQTND